MWSNRPPKECRYIAVLSIVNYMLKISFNPSRIHSNIRRQNNQSMEGSGLTSPMYSPEVLMWIYVFDNNWANQVAGRHQDSFSSLSHTVPILVTAISPIIQDIAYKTNSSTSKHRLSRDSTQYSYFIWQIHDWVFIFLCTKSWFIHGL